MRSRGLTSILVAAIVYLGVAGVISVHAAQDATTPPTSLANALPPNATGADIYRLACSTCHALDGTGSPQELVGFPMPLPDGHTLPDFSDCASNTAEPFRAWNSIVHGGGPQRGMDRHMPEWQDALTDAQIELVVKHLWTLCTDPKWPRGDLNFPRPQVTEKAFPENEWVWSGAFQFQGAKEATNDFIYEHRIKQRAGYELVVPLGFQQPAPGGAWNRGLGDVEFAVRNVFAANLAHKFIFSAGGAVTMPTGKEEVGLGEGVTVWEPFAMFGKGLGKNGFVQAQGGYMASSNRATVENSTYLRQAWGYTLAQQHGIGRTWTPMTEIIWSKEDHGGANVVDIIPQMQVSLSKMQHILFNVGASVPVTARDGRHPQLLTYVVWDWFEGGLFQFWK
jgi:Cytochrome C oxidase, cbb3-type, subunit III